MLNAWNWGKGSGNSGRSRAFVPLKYSFRVSLVNIPDNLVGSACEYSSIIREIDRGISRNSVF